MTESTVQGYAAADGGTDNVQVDGGWNRPDATVVEAFASHSTANIGDAAGRLGMPDGGLKPIWSGAKAAGTALPVLVTAGDDLAVIEAVSQIRPGDVIVINGFGYTGRAVMGDILSQMFAAKGATAAIVDGAVRDAAEIESQGFPVWARAVTPAGPWKNGPGTVGKAVAIGGVVVHPGDIIVADGDGIVCVPRADADRVLADLKRVVEFERQMQQANQEVIDP
jgi:regulator of RNase E activity RraA